MNNPITPPTQSLVQFLATPSKETRDEITRLSFELSSGEASNVASVLNNDFSNLGLIERDISIADSIGQSIERGKRFSASAQFALSGIEGQISGLRDELIPLVTGAQAEPNSIENSARLVFQQIVKMINSQQDGGAVFASGRSDANAVSSPDDILTDFDTALSGATSFDDVRLRTQAFFGAGGAYETSAVASGSSAEFSFLVSRDKSLNFALRAGDDRFSKALEAVGMLIAVAGSNFSEQPSAQDFYAIEATANLAEATGGIISMGAEVGRVQAQLEAASERLSADLSVAMQSRNDLIGADPYETATRLQEETARLETIYTLTARLSRLRLTDYL